MFGFQIVELNQPLFSRKIASTSFWDFGATPPISTSKLNFGGFICFMVSSVTEMNVMICLFYCKKFLCCDEINLE